LNPLNKCGACRCDFTSLRLFDLHRVGVHAYTYSEGLLHEPLREDGRRCLDAEEMEAKGWQQDANGRWLDPSHVKRAREYWGQVHA
jgi:hypothetical protein